LSNATNPAASAALRLSTACMLAACVLSACMLSACDNAVQANKRMPYAVQGDARSVLYPLSVKRDSEDVHIVLKESAPVPEVFSVDPSGRAEVFNFTIEGHTVTVPGKFDHIQLRHEGAAAIDIVSEDTVK
jgi:hypothetical protein